MQRDCYRKVRDTTCPCLRGSQQSLPLIFTHPLGALTLWWSCHALLLSRVTQSPTPRHGPLITDICWVPTMPGTVPSTCTQDLFSFHLDISATYTDEHTKASTSEFTLSQYLTLRSPDSKTKVLFQDPKILGLGFLVFFFFLIKKRLGKNLWNFSWFLALLSVSLNLVLSTFCHRHHHHHLFSRIIILHRFMCNQGVCPAQDGG